ncbi:MAG: hypothetical protein AAB459_00405 [Patescibacteria group bacterium]
MIQLNLLPDVKQEYINARRSKRMVVMISLMASGGSLALLIALFIGVYVFQKQHMDNLKNNIQTKSEKLKQEPELDKILTIQNQLNSLKDLYEKRPIATKFFNYLNKITPTEITVSNTSVDYVKNTMVITGGASNLTEINKFVDTIKFTKYSDAGKDSGNAFKNVVLSSYTLGDAEKSTKAGYTINLEFNPDIFDAKKDTDISVNIQFTTRSETEKPSLLQSSSQQTEGAQ